MKAKDWEQCNYCGDEETTLTDYYGTQLCESCIEMDRTTDWETLKEDRRRIISEANEY